jgi:hypothetical protein
MNGQFERSGVPVSWSLTNQTLLFPSWHVLQELNQEALIAEDEMQTFDRSKPYRFASALQTDFSLDNSGRWTNLLNGDRIWILGIEMGSAFSLGITLRNIDLPRGGRIYIYTEDHGDYLGPLTSRDNTSGFLGIPHIRGERIVIEYYEPYAYRGDGRFIVDHVAGAYRDLSDPAVSAELSCYRQVNNLNSPSGASRVASSVLMMMVDYGQKMASAALLNNSKSDATPYVLTSSECLIGPASSWVFYFNMNQFRCSDFFSCDRMVLSGANIVRNDIEQGVGLLKLFKSPPAAWDVFFCGWSLGEGGIPASLIGLHHSEALSLAISEYETSWTESNTDDRSIINLELASDGRTFQGSLGAPLFDDEWNLIGIFTGGSDRCDSPGSDQFALLVESWSGMGTFLDPLQIVQNKIPGIYPEFPFDTAQTVAEEISFFPNPANDWIYVRNESESRILSVVLMNSAGQVVQSFQPTVPTISIEGLPEGFYFIEFITGKSKFTHKLLVR